MNVSLSAAANGISIQRYVLEDGTSLVLEVTDTMGVRHEIRIHSDADCPYIKEKSAVQCDTLADDAQTWMRVRTPLFIPQITDECDWELEKEYKSFVA